jgi:DNA-binding transcriptional MerR regulator
LLTATEAATLAGVKPATIRDWVRRQELRPFARYRRTGAALFLEADVLVAERRIRARRAA